MRVKLAILAMSLMLSGVAMAQPGRGDGQRMNPEDRTKMMVTRMTEQLNLSEKQSAEIQKIFTEQFAAMKDAGQDQDARAKLRTETDAKIKKVLSDDQYKQWKESMANRQGKDRPQGNKDGKSGRHGQGKK